jgi:ABC-2 type transport system permease protein
LRSRSASWWWLLRKEWRELRAARAWWVLLFLMGPLVGFAFISAVRTYAEASGFNGSAAGVGEAFSPLVGIWAPTFSACELAAVFLLPFVAIRLMAGDRQSGALKVELQHQMPAIARVAAKVIVLGAGWLLASGPAAIAVVLWRFYGGTIYNPELATVAFGHMTNAGLTISLAAAASSMTDHPATAAIVTLSVTVGTWILNFVAAVQGGIWERLARYTPTAMVAEFQHGLIRLDVVLAAAALIAIGIGLATIWIRLGVAVRRRVLESFVLAACGLVVVSISAMATASWDTSESRRNSFSQRYRSRSASKCISRQKTPGGSISIDACSRSCAGCARMSPCATSPPPVLACSSRPMRGTARCGSTSVAARPRPARSPKTLCSERSTRWLRQPL